MLQGARTGRITGMPEYMPNLTGRPLFASFSNAALRHNAELAKRLAPAGGRVFGVVKADAYGHGLLECARVLAPVVDGFAILELEAARQLRAACHTGPILMLEGFHHPVELQEFSALGLATVVHRQDQIDALAEAALQQPVEVFLKLNTGMNRLGFPLADARAAYDRLQSLSQVAGVSVMTHFADADNARGTAWQLDRLKAHWPDVMASRTSFANSAALLSGPADRQLLGDVVRPGIMLYGASPWGGSVIGKTAADFGLRPVMTLRSQLIAVQDLQPGERVGYGGTFTAERPMRVGIVAGGYADGYPRHATNQTPILVDGQRTLLTGRVSMDRLCCDVTNISTAQVGSMVTLWGEGLPADEVADSAGTIAYELFCALSPRVPHVWVD